MIALLMFYSLLRKVMFNKKMLSKVILAALCFVLLAGCGQSKERYLLNNPEKLKAILENCQQMGKEKALKNEDCVYAIKLYRRAFIIVKELSKGPKALGHAILSAQMEFAQNQTKLNVMDDELAKVAAGPKKDALQKERDGLVKQQAFLQHNIQTMLIFAAQMEGKA